MIETDAKQRRRLMYRSCKLSLIENLLDNKAIQHGDIQTKFIKLSVKFSTVSDT